MWTYQRIMRVNNVPAVCRLCGIDNKKVLVIRHKDQNRKNNVIENLIWLCGNCHYLIHNGKTL